MYERQTAGSMEVGSYAHRPIFHRADDIPSIQESRLSPTELPFTAEDFDPQLEEALELMPDLLSTAEIKYAINGLLSLTPDGFPLLGETPEVRNLWSAAAVWIKEGPGAGRMMAEWMTHGVPEIDPHQSDIARFYPYARNDHHVRARCAEHFNKTYGIVHPREQWASERNLRCAPYHARTEALGAVYFQAGGWERPHWYDVQRAARRALRRRGPAGTSGTRAGGRRSCNAEHLAMRERVGMVDLAPFVIFDISRPGRARLPAGPHRQQLRRRRRPLRVHAAARPRTAASAPTSRSCASPTTSFRVVTGAFDGPRDEHWFRTHLPADGSVTLRRQHLGARARSACGGRRRGTSWSRRDRGRHLRRRLPLRHHAGGAVRLDPRAALPHLLRRRARLGDLRPDGERPRRLGPRCGRRARRSASSPSAPASTARPAGSRRATG